ncbi:MAG: hypothetical protein WDM77_08755 [Steroidobacteraceae bacterium]
MDDNEKDPYSAGRGFWFSHIGWMVRDYKSGEVDFTNIPDLKRDKMLAFQHKHYALLTQAANFGIPALVGWALGDIWGALLLTGCCPVWSSATTSRSSSTPWRTYGARVPIPRRTRPATTGCWRW